MAIVLEHVSNYYYYSKQILFSNARRDGGGGISYCDYSCFLIIIIIIIIIFLLSSERWQICVRVDLGALKAHYNKIRNVERNGTEEGIYYPCIRMYVYTPYYILDLLFFSLRLLLVLFIIITRTLVLSGSRQRSSSLDSPGVGLGRDNT